MKLTKYVVHIEEVLARDVIIEAACKEDAYEIAENKCNDGEINLDGNDFVSRNVEVLL